MANSAVPKQVSYSWLLLICGALAAGAGAIALLGWMLGQPFLSSLGTGRIPVAPSTALLFVLYGLTLLLRSRPVLNHRQLQTVAGVHIFGLLFAFILFILSVQGIYLGAEHFGFSITDTVGEAPIGHMSPVTAILFVLTSLAFLLSLPSAANRLWRAVSASVFACLVTVIAFVLILAYFFGMPLFYSGQFVPPAWMTSLTFEVLGIALIALAAPRLQPVSQRTVAGVHVSFLLLLVFLIVVTGIVTGGYLYYQHYQKSYQTQIENQLLSISELKIADLVQWREGELDHANYFYKNPVISSLFTQYLQTPEDPEVLRQLRIRILQIQSAYHYDRVFLLSSDGRIITSQPDVPGEVATHLEKDILDVIRTAEVTFIDFHQDIPGGPVYLAVMIPILDGTNSKVLGAVVLRIDPDKYLYPLISRWPAPSQTAETLLVRREGDDVLYLNELRFNKDSALSLRFPLSAPDLPAAQAVLGRRGVMQGNDYRGKPVIAALSAIPNSPWFMVARMDVAESFAPLREIMWVTIILVGALLLGAGGSVGFIWRRQNLAFYREKAAITGELENSERNFHNSLEESPMGVRIDDAEGSMLYVNRALLDIYGYNNAADLEAAPSQQRYTPESYAGHLVRRQKRQRGEYVPPEYEISIVRKDGEIRHLEVMRKEVLWNGSPQVQSLYRDITDRKRAEERIRQMHDVLTALRDVNQLITREKDRRVLIRQSCQIMVRTRGARCAWILLLDDNKKFMASEAAGDNIGEFQEQLGRGNFPPCVERILAHEDSLAKFSDIDGIDASCFPRYTFGDGDGIISRLEYEGKLYGVISMYAASNFVIDADELSLFRELAGDISFALASIEREGARMKAEEDLRRSEEQLRITLESIPQGVLTVGLDGQILQVNDAVIKLHGYANEQELIGRSSNELISETDRAKVSSHLKRALDTGRNEVIESVLVRKGGVGFSAELGAAVLKDAGGSPRGLVIVVEDITERKQRQAALIVTDRLASIGELAAGIAHELNNPLTGVIGFSDLLMARQDLPQDIREDLALINKEAVRASQVARHLLTFARKHPDEKKPEDVNRIIRDVLALRAYEQKVHNITVKAQLAEDLPAVRGNAFQLQQVFINIIINAEYFMLEAHGRGILNINTQSAGGVVRISITDDGPGISPDNLGRIFDPFFTTKEVGKGTGLGLSICYGMIMEHGGRIWVESELRKGSTFIVEIPVFGNVTGGK